MEQVIAAFDQHILRILEETTDRIITENLGIYSAMSRDQLKQLAAAVVGAFRGDLVDGTERQIPAYWEKVAGQRAQQGARIEEILRASLLNAEVMDSHMRSALAGDAEARAWWAMRMHTIIVAGIMVQARIFNAAHEQVIRDQESQIRELSTPIIPVHTGVLVLPLVGAIDSHRASQVMETLLTGISEQQADVVIIDITGVPVVDTGVGNYLIQAARAAQLLGSRVVLVGISAEVAQTMVQLGVELAGIITRANLQAGIEYALSLQGLAIQPVAAQPASRSSRLLGQS